MSPITAVSVLAVTTSTPGIVISRRTSSSATAIPAITRSTAVSSSPRKSSWRRHPSTVRRSSSGSCWAAIHSRPFLPNESLAGLRPFRLRCMTALISFLIWVRRLTSPRRRETSRRIARVRSSPIHTRGIRSAASRSAKTLASTLSVLMRAWLIARTCLACASTTSATWGWMIRAIASALPVASITTRSSGARLRANSSSCSGVAATRPATRARPSPIGDCDLAEVAMHVQPDRSAHHRPPVVDVFDGRRWAKRHLRIRARSAPGQVAGAASYTSELAAHRNGSAYPTAFLPGPVPERPRRYAPPRTSPAGPRSILMPVHHATGRDRCPALGRPFVVAGVSPRRRGGAQRT